MIGLVLFCTTDGWQDLEAKMLSSKKRIVDTQREFGERVEAISKAEELKRIALEKLYFEAMAKIYDMEANEHIIVKIFGAAGSPLRARIWPRSSSRSPPITMRCPVTASGNRAKARSEPSNTLASVMRCWTGAGVACKPSSPIPIMAIFIFNP